MTNSIITGSKGEKKHHIKEKQGIRCKTTSGLIYVVSNNLIVSLEYFFFTESANLADSGGKTRKNDIIWLKSSKLNNITPPAWGTKEMFSNLLRLENQLFDSVANFLTYVEAVWLEILFNVKKKECAFTFHCKF